LKAKHELLLKTTKVFTKNFDALLNKDVRFVVNTGGSRSSKSWSLLQMIVVYCISNPRKTVSIVRKSFPSLKKTVMKDFFSILKENDIYDVKSHNKTDSTYIFPGTLSEVQFFSLDDSQKIRGSKRDLLFMNEANEIDYESFQQLNFRTTERFS
jgi:phage terminase large subunit